MVRPAGARSNGKSLVRPGGGKDIAKTKGVHREVEAEVQWNEYIKKITGYL